MQRSLVNFQPLGPLNRAKGAGSRLFYGAWSCLLTNPGQKVWLGSHSGAHGSAVCDDYSANTDVKAVLLCGHEAMWIFIQATYQTESVLWPNNVNREQLWPFQAKCQLSGVYAVLLYFNKYLKTTVCHTSHFLLLKTILKLINSFELSTAGSVWKCELSFGCESCIYTFILLPLHFKHTPSYTATVCANELRWVLPTAEACCLATHYSKWVSGEPLCSCGRGRLCCIGPHQCNTACSRIRLNQQTNTCAAVQISLSASTTHFKPDHKKKGFIVLGFRRSVKIPLKCCKSPGITGQCNLMWPLCCAVIM